MSDTWRKSSFSEPNGNACVEVAHTTETIGVRDTKDRAAAPLAFPANAWAALLRALTG